MLRVLNRRLLGLLLLTALVAACDDENTPTTPTPTPDPVTRTFSGTVARNGAATHDFAVSGGGQVRATLQQIGPDSGLVAGFALGNWNATASSCSVVLSNDAATTGAVLQGTVTAAGTLCVRIFDVGNIPAGTPAPYTVQVVHP